MLSSKLLVLLFFLFASTCLNDAEQLHQQVQVQVQDGTIVGESITSDATNHRTLHRFLGIPYAQPPVGKLRFRRPFPVEPWSKPIEAVHWPKNCYQNSKNPHVIMSKKYMSNQEFSEDCLYLNIWSPQANVTDEHKLRPVLVWIHGGSLLLGSSTQNLYDGETLAAVADAVIVTINYRISTLGFLYSDEVPDVRGNQGLWDQAMALEWIQENIRYFGGNPNAVTIMGESAGSWSVSLQVLSPVGRKLFHNGIMMSGAAITGPAGVILEPHQAVPTYLKAIRQVGCASEADTTINQRVIECLEQLDLEKVDQIVYLTQPDPLNFPSVVVVDGEFLPATPSQLLANGDFKTDVNLLVSTVEDEGSFILYNSDPRFSRDNPKKITLGEAKQFLTDLIAKSFVKNDVLSELIERVYFHGFNDKIDDDDLFRRQVGIAFGDLILACPTLDFAKKVKQHSGSNGGKVYQWHYRAKLGKPKFLCSRWGGTCHTDDIYAVFGLPFRHPELYHPREQGISAEVINFISSFIRTGSPVGGENSEWEQYLNVDNQSIIAPYYEITNEYSTRKNYRFNHKHVECEQVWNKYINNNNE